MKCQYRVFGMKRAGNHAIIYWIAAQYREKVLFLNDIKPGLDPLDGNMWAGKSLAYNTEHLGKKLERMGCVNLWGGERLESFRGYDGPVILSYEDWYLGDLSLPVVPEGAMPCDQTINLTITRDLPNWLASYVKKRRDAGKTVGREEVTKLLEWWKPYARSYAGWSSDVPSPRADVSFNRWKLSEDYRKSLAAELELAGGVGTEMRGARSSFVSSSSDVFSRWSYLRGEDWLDLLLNDDTLRELSIAIDSRSAWIFDQLMLYAPMPRLIG